MAQQGFPLGIRIGGKKQFPQNNKTITRARVRNYMQEKLNYTEVF